MAGHWRRRVLEYGRTYLEQFCDRANGHEYAYSRMDHQFGGTLGWSLFNVENCSAVMAGSVSVGLS